MSGRISVIGLGYIGLPTAVALAKGGYDVLGVDVNPSHVNAVNKGRVPFLEPGLDEALAAQHAAGRINAATEPKPSDAYIVAVPTPFLDSHEADLSYVLAATEAISKVISADELIILESTSPVGTTEKMAQRLYLKRPELEGKVLFAHCPERVLPGRIMVEMFENDRIVGGLTPQAAQRAKTVYESFCEGEILLTDARTAELSKLAENSFRDVNIAFANELAKICEHLDIDVWELIKLANRHPRVNILQPGVGVGGHCIAVDPWFIVSCAPQQAKIIKQARMINDSRPDDVVAAVRKELEILDACDSIAPRQIGALGLAFKPDVDDLRTSAAITVVEKLCALDNVEILVAEPHIKELPSQLSHFDNLKLVSNAQALSAPLVVSLVRHSVFTTHPRPNGILVDKAGIWA